MKNKPNKKSVREIKRITPILNKVNSFTTQLKSIDDQALRSKASELRSRIQSLSEQDREAALEKALPEAFALVREASRRAINKEHFDVQILSGIVLSQGRISEAKTGEGKTITIFLPAFLEALLGKGVHVVTVNDYLADRDSAEARSVLSLLGMTVGCVTHESTPDERRDAYNCDVTYVTNHELGFDYLKDNLVQRPEDRVLRGLHYAIIDEVDSILIDEARTPLIISGGGPEPAVSLTLIDSRVKTLVPGEVDELSKLEIISGRKAEETGDVIVDKKENRAWLTDAGREKLYGMLPEETDLNSMEVQKLIDNAVRANFVMVRDVHYIVDDGLVLIVDEHTGRTMPGRRFSNGLHQAIEAKEGVEIQKENVTIAQITYQSFFNKYRKKCGLTGTAMTEENEFKEIYGMDVVEIPTNKPMIRDDKVDYVFKTKEEKWMAVVEEIKETHSTGQPILIGTVSVEDSEHLSEMLKEANIAHEVLNAKNNRREAEIISHAGEFGAVTVSTNMAGRGTDIMLDFRSKEIGGLKVIGTERHDSRRIDNQLIGRSGRQGDPGESRFFISLEDKLLDVFGNKDAIENIMMLSCPYGKPIEFAYFGRMIEKAQKAIESNNFAARQSLLKYDEANSEHREEIYRQRNEILDREDVSDIIDSMISATVSEVVESAVIKFDKDEEEEVLNSGGYVYKDESGKHTAIDFEKLFLEFGQRFVPVTLNISNPEKATRGQWLKVLSSVAFQIYGKRREKWDEVKGRKNLVEKQVLLRMIDRNWADFMSYMEYYRIGVGNYTYAQKDPVTEYKMEGVRMFNEMIRSIRLETVKNLFTLSVQTEGRDD